MLQSLHIENYVLIRELDIDFNRGFSVITGETGSGKSILLGALHLLLGGRAEGKVIRDGAKRCVVEAVFDLRGYGMEPFFNDHGMDYEEQCILRREMTDSGKSRLFAKRRRRRRGVEESFSFRGNRFLSEPLPPLSLIPLPRGGIPRND